MTFSSSTSHAWSALTFLPEWLTPRVDLVRWLLAKCSRPWFAWAGGVVLAAVLAYLIYGQI